MQSFSIVIPAYNCENTLFRAVESVLFQLSPQDEIIIVDDCSTDLTFETAKALADADSRVKAYRMPRNCGCLNARAEGILKTAGDKILFLDGDDEYCNDTIQTLRKEIEADDAEIIHFGLNMWVTNGETKHLDEKAGKWFAPFCGRLTGVDVFAKCFCDRKYNWNLVNKCFDAALCRKACCMLPPCTVQRGEDACLYFIMSYYAQSYRGLKDTHLYQYYFGAGQDSARMIHASEYAELCKSIDAARAIDSFLQAESSISDIHRKGYETVRRALSDGCANKLRDNVCKADFLEGMNIFINAWGYAPAIDSLTTSFGLDGARFADQIDPITTAPLKPGDTLASFYYEFSGGGAENVQRMLVKRWKSLGLNVVLLMEEEPDSTAIDELNVEWRKLPKANAGQGARSCAIQQAVKDYDIKGVVYHQWVREGLFWDLLAFKLAGASFFIHCHGIFTHCAFNGSAYFSKMPSVYHHADAIISLSKVDATRWQRCNTRTFVTINPASFPAAKFPTHPKDKRVLWLGRIAPEKRPIEAIDVFARVLEIVPDAKMDFVGGAIDPQLERSVIEHAQELGIGNAVNFTGWSDEKQKYYERAKVFLMTSDPKEGYPLTLGECQSLGIPCVMYELPYLTLTRNNSGIIQVPYGDINSAAESIARILEDDDLREKMAESALETAKQLERFDFDSFWQTVLMTRNHPNEITPDTESNCIAWQTLDIAYREGYRRKDAEIERLRNQCKRLERTAEVSKKQILNLQTQVSKLNERETRISKREKDLRNSVSFKTGRAITFIPRKAKRFAHKITGGDKH